jgi:hemerythrin-like metal-binding protein
MLRADAAALAAAAGITIYRVLTSVFSAGAWQTVMSLMAGLITLAAIALLTRAKKPFTTALGVPLLLLAHCGLTGFTLYGFAHFDLIYLIICCVGMLYFDKKAFLCLLAFGAAFTAFLTFAAPLLPLRFAATGPDAGAFAILLAASVLLYLICADGADRLKNAAGSLELADEELQAGESFRGYYILLAEDVAINREIALALLEQAEIGADCAENGAEAVKMFAAAPERYNMIWLDEQMPEMGGCEAARRIRLLDTPRASVTPIVAMVDALRGDKDGCLRAGMNDWVDKPLDLTVILSKLRKYLRPGGGASEEIGEAGEFDWSHGLAWSPELETGNEEIDAQHRQLFRLTSALVDACAKGRSTAVLGEALDFLAAYTVRHFADEEALQIHYRFPGYARHKKAHDDFKETVAALIREYKAGESAEELSAKVNSIIAGWLVRHIRGEDAKIAEHIRTVSLSWPRPTRAPDNST